MYVGLRYTFVEMLLSGCLVKRVSRNGRGEFLSSFKVNLMFLCWLFRCDKNPWICSFCIVVNMSSTWRSHTQRKDKNFIPPAHIPRPTLKGCLLRGPPPTAAYKHSSRPHRHA